MKSLDFALPASTPATEKLRAEIVAAGKQVAAAYISEGMLRVSGDTLSEADRPAIQTVIDRHDATPTEQELRPVNARAKIAANLTAVENAVSDKATWDGLTAAQRQEATRRAGLLAVKTVRILLNQFDVPEA